MLKWQGTIILKGAFFLMDLSIIFLVVLIVFLGSLTRSTFGFGDSVISMPLLALLPISIHTTISLVGLTGFTIGIMAVFSAWKFIDKRILFYLSLSTIIGIPLGLYLVKSVPQEMVTKVLGVFLLFYGIYSLIKERFHLELPEKWRESNILPLPFGFLSGALGSAYNMNGIPIVIYGTFRNMEMRTFHSTLQSHFIISSLFIVIGHMVSGFWSNELLLFYLASLPMIYVAHRIGKWVREHLPVYRFEKLLYLFILFLGVMLFVSS